MKVLAELNIIPMGVGVSVSTEVAVCVDIFRERGLHLVVQPLSTAVEGDFEIVLEAIKVCHDRLHGDGVPRVFTHVKFTTRIDREQSLSEKVEAVISKVSLS